jgi:hypothetical protein
MRGSAVGLGFAIAVMLALLVVALGIYDRRRPMQSTFCLGLAARLAGSISFYAILVYYYHQGDSLSYFRTGSLYADQFASFDFSPLYDRSQWIRGTWWGTQFMYSITGISIAFFGSSILFQFILFSLLSFTGLLLIGVAFKRTFPDVPLYRYTRWIWLYPSLWFWSASISKEVVVLLGLGLATYGYVGKLGRVRWVWLALGLLTIMTVRPQVAAIAGFSIAAAQTFAARERWTWGRLVQTGLLIGAGAFAVLVAAQSLRLESLDPEAVQDYIDESTGGSTGGASSVQRGVGVFSPIMSVVNTMFRPFLWEARSVVMLLSGLELFVFWTVIYIRRRDVRTALQNWRSSRLLRFALIFVVVYVISLGLVAGNMGLIVRQRVFVFPFLFMFLEAFPRPRSRSVGDAAVPGFSSWPHYQQTALAHPAGVPDPMKRVCE